MRVAPGLTRPVLLSLVLHLALVLALFWAARESVMTEPAPVSVELWSAAPSQPAVVVTPPTPVAPPTPEVTPPADVPQADIHLADKVQPKKVKPVASQPRAMPKPLPTPKVEAKAPPVNKHKPPSKPQADDSNDLLATLGAPNRSRPANAHVDQAGAANGVAGGVPNGSAQARDNYAAKVRAKILPLVQIPPGMQGSPKAVVQVRLLPTLEVQSVTLLQSSGNRAYDEAVQRAIQEAGTFPSLPNGTRFGDVRQLRLEFRPQ